jgi:hypothetical protein
MFQATPELNISAMTVLATIGIKDSNTAIFGADFIPLALAALYSLSPALDIVGSFGLGDLKSGVDLFDFTAGVRWYN